MIVGKFLRERVGGQNTTTYMSLRLDRLATLYVASPLLRLVSEQRLSIPILMYHSIAEKDESRVHAYYRTTTSPLAFAAQMEYLYRNGYQSSSLAEAIALLKGDIRSVAKRVVITFDDGYRNFYQTAFPVLNRFGLTATVFLPTAYIGETTLKFNGQDCMTWAEVRELQRYGILFGSHTVTHPQLRTLGKDAIEKEVANSKSTIEEKTGCAVDSFAYPDAFPQAEIEFKKMLREALRRAGYRTGVCTTVGRAGCGTDPYFMERIPVNSCDDMALFQAKLSGAYDWISRFQSAVKMAKTRAAGICRQT